MTDYSIIMQCFAMQPAILVIIVVSGVLSLAYNMLLYSMAQNISPEYAAWCSNINKVAAIWLSVLFGFEKTPAVPGSIVFYLGCVGTFSAFAFASQVRPPASLNSNKT